MAGFGLDISPVLFAGTISPAADAGDCPVAVLRIKARRSTSVRAIPHMVHLAEPILAGNQGIHQGTYVDS